LNRPLERLRVNAAQLAIDDFALGREEHRERNCPLPIRIERVDERITLGGGEDQVAVTDFFGIITLAEVPS
jgi:hypothetical protein